MGWSMSLRVLKIAILVGLFVSIFVACSSSSKVSTQNTLTASANSSSVEAVIPTSIVTHPSQLPKNKLEAKQVKPERWELPNGLVVHYLYDDELPLVNATLYVRGGSLLDPAHMSGLAAATGSLMRNGGTIDLTPDALDALLDARAASIGSSFSDEYGEVGLGCLAEDFEEIFGHFFNVVAHPRFDAGRIEILKQLSRDEISRRGENPQAMAAMTFALALFGADSAFSRVPTMESLSAIGRQEIISFHSNYVRPQGAHLAISGAVTKQVVENMLERTFGKWGNNVNDASVDNTSASDQKANNQIVWPQVPSEVKSAGIYVLERKLDQAQVVLGHVGPTRFVPEQYAIVLFNRIFGLGSMDNVLFREIRSKAGLAYSVYGGIFPGSFVGSFQVEMGTRNEQVINALDKSKTLIKNVTVDALLETPFSEQEILDAQTAVAQSFVFKFPSASSIVNRAAILESLGYPADYDEKYLSNISNITPNMVHAAAKKLVSPDNLVAVIVGGVSADEIRKAVGENVPVYKVTFDQVPRIR